MKLKNKFFCILLLIASSCTHPLSEDTTNTPVGNFEALWTIIDEKYCFVDEKGIKWDSIHDAYEPKIQALDINNERALFDTLASMLDNLQDGHVNLYSDFDIYSCSSFYSSYPVNYNVSLIISKYIQDYKRAGALIYNRIENGEVGYIMYQSFQDGFTSRNMAYVLDYFKDCKGIIVDVRSNGGGSIDYAEKLAATFFDDNKTIGYTQHKTGPGHDEYSTMQPMDIDINMISVHWHKPVVVLCNRRSYSATNLFVSAMRYTNNSTIVGQITGGGGGMPMSYELPNGWMVRLSSIRMYDKDKNSIENGIRPDIEQDMINANTDDIIDCAIQLIKQ